MKTIFHMIKIHTIISATHTSTIMSQTILNKAIIEQKFIHSFMNDDINGFKELIDANQFTDYKRAFNFALVFNRIEFIKYIITLPNFDVSYDDNYAFKYASICELEEIVQFLSTLPCFANIVIPDTLVDNIAVNELYLMAFYMKNDIDGIKEMYESRINVDYKKAINWALMKENIATIEYFNNLPNFDMSYDDNYAFKFAKSTGRTSIINILSRNKYVQAYCIREITKSN